MEREYELQEKELMEKFIDFNLFPKPKNTDDYVMNMHGLELIIRPQCNQQCEYCYIYQHGHELYPTLLTKEETLNNLRLVLDYLYNDRKQFFYEIEFFAGDLFYDGIYFDIVDEFKKYLTQIKKDYPELFELEIALITPSNLAWVYNKPEYVEKFKAYSKMMKEECNTTLAMSWSTDGKYATDSREKQTLPDEYFDTIFQFCQSIGAGYHPMIAAENISTWIENYDWWMEKFEQYQVAKDAPKYFEPFLLHTRNDNWTDENIADYNKLLDHMMEKRLEMNDNSKSKLAYHLLVGDGKDGTLPSFSGCDPLDSVRNDRIYSWNEDICCSCQHFISINCTNLSIVNCHRTTYPQFTGCYLLLNEEKTHIVDIKPQNVPIYMTLRMSRMQSMPQCNKCKWLPVCKQGCFGAQFEHSGEIFAPIPSVCKMMQETNSHLIDLYYQYGIYDEMVENDIFVDKDSVFYTEGLERGYIVENERTL